MKKTTRSLLISALILFCTGLLLAFGTTLYAKIKKIEVYDVAKKARTIENISVGIDEILTHSPESNYVKQLSQNKFTRIDLSSFVGDVIIVATDEEESNLRLDETNTNNITYSVIGDTLTVSEVDPVGFMGFYVGKGGISFKGLRHMFNPGNATNGDKTITIKVPSSLSLTQVDVYSNIGNVTIDGISVATLNVDVRNGNLKIKNLLNAEGKINVKGNFVDVEMEKNLYANCAISTRFGTIKTKLVENSDTSTILDLWCGDIDVETAHSTTFYKLSISTSVGTVFNNEKDCGKKLNSDGSGAARISSGIFFGDFNLNSVNENAEEKSDEAVQDEEEATATQETPEQPAT